VDRSRIARLLSYPVVWFGVQLAELAVAVWVVRLLAPDSWPAAVAILAVLVAGLTVVNVRLRRRFLAEDPISRSMSKT
jgi:membrane protein implicated in regulation of membrane protease activity